MPDPTPRPAPVRPRRAVAYWTLAVLAYAGAGALFPPLLLLGFWQSLPALLVITIVAGRLFPRPVPPLPPPEG